MRESWEVLEADVLVVGGGFGGLWAALRAAECGSSVLLVDKSFAGKSGHSYLAGGSVMVMLPEDDLDQYVRDVARGNEWLVDQEMVQAVFEGSYPRLKDLESFGLSFRRAGGSYVWTRARGTRVVKNLWPENATAADEVTMLRRVALSRDVEIVNHVYVYDLLRDREGSIAGAAGIGVKDGRNYVLKAKGTVLATNTGSYRGHHLACELQGTGPFMAYDAGAAIKNPEFHFINIRPAKHEIEGSGIMPAIGARWINARGNHFMEEYDPELKDRAPAFKIVLSAAREAVKGNAPISMHVEGMSEEERERFRVLQVSHGWMRLLFDKCERKEGYNPLRNNIEWQPAYEVNKLGIRSDIHCATSLQGLFMAGMARTLGINTFTGWSIASCTWSGYTAGESAARYASGSNSGAVDLDDLREKHGTFTAPIRKESGSDPDDLVHEIQKILFPVDVLIIMNGTNLQHALDRVLRLREEKAPDMSARDVRTLIKVKETQTMFLSAEMTLRACLMRKETRENIYYREDFPQPDNANWLKWIVVQKGERDEMNFSTEEIPYERYRFRPEKN